MPDADPNTLGAVPWYQSPVQIAQVSSLVSTLVALFPQVGKAMGLETPSAVSNAVTLVFGVIAGVAALFGMVKRAKSNIQPLTLTQAKADVHPATLLANSTLPKT